MWDAYNRHPWMAHAMASITRPAPAPNALSYTEWMARIETQFKRLAATGAYPFLNSLTEHDDFEFALESVFEFGLSRILDGITVPISKLHT